MSMAHYLDYYLFCEERNSGKCRFILHSFQLMAKELVLPLAQEKMEGPALSFTFLGIELDTVQQTPWLPKSKLADLRIKIAALLQKQKMSLHELQEIVGHLNFTCRVIAAGHTFLHQL